MNRYRYKLVIPESSARLCFEVESPTREDADLLVFALLRLDNGWTVEVEDLGPIV